MTNQKRNAWSWLCALISWMGAWLAWHSYLSGVILSGCAAVAAIVLVFGRSSVNG